STATAMKAPSRQAPPSRQDADTWASALQRSTEPRGPRATRGGAGRMAHDLRPQWANRRARAAAGYHSTQRKLDAHEGTAGRALHRACETTRHRAAPSHRLREGFPVAVLQESRARQFSSGSLPTHRYERAARTTTPPRRSSRREGCAARPLHLDTTWRRWH